MREHHDANHLPFHLAAAGVDPDDDATTRRGLALCVGESVRQWHPKGHLLQEMHSLENRARDDVGNLGIPSSMVSLADFHAL
jgi:hypothetical protein